MSSDWVALSDCLVIIRPPETRIAYHDGHYYSADAFYSSVKFWVERFKAEPFQHYALYTNDAYPFTVLLFALFHAGKTVWIAGNNRPDTAQQLKQHGCELIGDWNAGLSFDYCLTSTDEPALSLSPLNPEATKLVIFTSGSTGQPKPIEKRLIQLQLEITALEKQWGKLLGDAEVLSTVSHQHIYGLLFRVLWPLSAGRCFHSSSYLNPEILVNNIKNSSAYWVASPAHLKRLDQNSPWQGIADLKAIFSSGGVLSEHVEQQIMTACEQSVIEIYGSSETGGIAWRQQHQHKGWTLFPDILLNAVDGNWHLSSPYLSDNTNYPLDDKITVLDDGRFTLHGRSDRIVKIEEKRLSLTELEQHLVAMPWIDEAHALVMAEKRDVVAVIAVLNQQGFQYLSEMGRNRFIKQLRKLLETGFEAVVLPRKWLFVNTMPLTQQGKLDQPLLTRLLDVENRKLPQTLNLEITNDGVQIVLKVPVNLIYFKDHFASFPILPGVVQLAWAEHFGKLFFDLNSPILSFSHLEVVKFIKTIRPGDELTLRLNWKATAKELHFNFSSSEGGCSSGRMVYKDSVK
jgi:acyl-CoA synthetase (AMP-forming)/AMP-acid ligase II/3-hydroxymyristoyl/3-hydroxydecanoyl-(acyl carrier protein) dehydratase